MTLLQPRSSLMICCACLLASPTLVRSDATRDTPVPYVLQEITVESRYWSEALREVPGTVEVITREQLETPRWNRIGALAAVSPNVLIEDSSVQTRVVMRGITSANTAVQDPLGYFVNDVALPLGASQAPALFDLEQMEVLKGPQGSLFGRNTEAGAIRVATTDPTWIPEARISLMPGLFAGAGRHAPAYVGSARISGPLLSGRLAGSLAVRGEQTEGVRRNLFDGANDGGRLGRWSLSGGLAAHFDGGTRLTFKSVVEQIDMGKRRMRYQTGPAATRAYITNYNADAWDDKTTAVQSLRLDHSFDGVELTAITGWTHLDHRFQMDQDVSPRPAVPTRMRHRDEALSQELRLTSGEVTDAWRWLAGMHVYHQWGNLDFRSGTPRVGRRLKSRQTGLAGFGQIEARLAADLRLTLGARLEWIDQHGDMALAKAATGAQSRFSVGLNTFTVLPKISLAYTPRPELTLYGSLARGYLPGGYNYSMATNASSLTYDPEYSWSAELGMKTRLWGERLVGSLAAFATRTQDKQILGLEPGGIRTFSNAAEAEIYGLEGALDARIAARWSLFATLGLQHAEATDYSVNLPRGGRLTRVDLAGNRLPMAAELTWSAGARYDQGQGWFVGATLNGSGPYYFDSRNTLRQDAFVKLDAEIGYRFGDLELALWANNLNGENVYARAVRTPLGAIVEDGAPREVGLRLSCAW